MGAIIRVEVGQVVHVNAFLMHGVFPHLRPPVGLVAFSAGRILVEYRWVHSVVVCLLCLEGIGLLVLSCILACSFEYLLLFLLVRILVMWVFIFTGVVYLLSRICFLTLYSQLFNSVLISVTGSAHLHDISLAKVFFSNI